MKCTCEPYLFLVNTEKFKEFLNILSFPVNRVLIVDYIEGFGHSYMGFIKIFKKIYHEIFAFSCDKILARKPFAMMTPRLKTAASFFFLLDSFKSRQYSDLLYRFATGDSRSPPIRVLIIIDR